MKTRPPPVHEVSAWRRRAVLGAMGLAACTVFGRAYQLQVVQRDFLTREGDRRALREIAVPAHRGAILDRSGQPLALSAPVESIWAVPAALLDAPAYVPPLAKLLGMKAGELKSLLSERRARQFVYLQRQMSPADADRVMRLAAPGVFSQREYRRFYPAGEVAGQLVGFCDIDGRGQEGLEAAYERTLSGTAGQRRVVQDASGRVIADDRGAHDAQPGDDLTLTIDLRLQYIAYRELKNAVVANHAKGGLVVVIAPASGEILAIANQPGFNPNRLDERDSDGLRNRAVTDLFEPGSAIKPLLIAHALELGAFRPDSLIDTGPGYFKVGALTVRDVHPNGVVDLARLLTRSSNVAAAKVGLALGAETVYSGYQKFGLGEPVGAGFPGEAVGVLRSWQSWGEITTVTASYGYGVSLTALHLVRAYAALAGDGLMPNLGFVRGAPPMPPVRVVPAAVAREVRHLLEGVVSEDGTAVRAAVSGYRVAGKTGTVKKPGPGGYTSGRYQSLFVGMIPAAQPRLVGVVMIDEPDAGPYYGGLVAAPVFAHVMQAAARLLQIAPENEPDLRVTALPGAREPKT